MQPSPLLGIRDSWRERVWMKMGVVECSLTKSYDYSVRTPKSRLGHGTLAKHAARDLTIRNLCAIFRRLCLRRATMTWNESQVILSHDASSITHRV